MTWPAGIETVLFTVGKTHDAPGNDLTHTLSVEADFGGARSITWAATNDTMTTLVGRAEGVGGLPVPVVDQVGWVDPSGSQVSEWAYRAQLVIRGQGQTRVLERRFKLRTGQVTVDFFDLPADEVGTPVTAPAAPLTLAQVTTAVLLPHVDSETPHPVYDDMLDLTLLFENGLL